MVSMEPLQLEERFLPAPELRTLSDEAAADDNNTHSRKYPALHTIAGLKVHFLSVPESYRSTLGDGIHA